MTKSSVTRIIDANCNRLKEALRVIEEVARFKKNHKVLTSGAKKLRHQVQKVILASPLSHKDLLKARQSSTDVGRASLVADKKKVAVDDLLIANFKRAQESIRVLEEFFKMSSISTSKKFQKIRFQIYSLEKQLL